MWKCKIVSGNNNKCVINMIKLNLNNYWVIILEYLTIGDRSETNEEKKCPNPKKKKKQVTDYKFLFSFVFKWI